MQQHGAHDSSLLWQNEDQSVLLIDIPASIAEAQCMTSGGGLDRQLLSCPPLDNPFPVIEPKSAKALANLQKRQKDPHIHMIYAHRSSSALQTLHDSYGQTRPYCLPRSTASPEVEVSLKRKETSSTDFELLGAVGAELYQHNESNELQWINDHVLMPPRAAFLLGDCRDTSSFRVAIRDYFEEHRPRHFDLILLDPPWPNSSARRGGGYRTESAIRDVGHLLLGMDLDAHIAANGFIAIWITNRAAVRELVLGNGGLFESWNVGLVEEWTWLKVTKQGEPVLPVNGLMRKPYETLLIGKAPHDRMMVASHQESPKSRVLASVPDLHSRKPCLKKLLENFLLDRRDGEYKAVEIFARHLTAGWLSWGNEAVKFNLKDCWTEVVTQLSRSEESS